MAEGDAVSADGDLRNIHRAQEEAWRCVRNGAPKPDIAIELLRSVRHEVDAREGSAEWATQECLTAMAYAVKDHDVALDFYEGAIQRLARVSSVSQRILLDFHRGFGKYFFRKGKLVDAQRAYETAEKVSMELGDEEEVADIHLKLFELGHKQTKDRKQEEEFTKFRRVATRLGTAKARQRSKWNKHVEKRRAAFLNSRFARGPEPYNEEYFEDLLNSEDDED